MVSIGSAFITGRPNRASDRAIRAAGVSLAVKLQHIGMQRLDDIGQHRVIGIDDERNLFGAVFDAASERVRGVQRNVARAWRKEHEAHHVGARVERGIEGLGRGEAADLNKGGHVSVRSTNEINCSSC